jgi:hypothetical protein
MFKWGNKHNWITWKLLLVVLLRFRQVLRTMYSSNVASRTHRWLSNYGLLPPGGWATQERCMQLSMSRCSILWPCDLGASIAKLFLVLPTLQFGNHHHRLAAFWELCQKGWCLVGKGRPALSNAFGQSTMTSSSMLRSKELLAVLAEGLNLHDLLMKTGETTRGLLRDVVCS